MTKILSIISLLFFTTYLSANKKYCTEQSDKQRITSIYLDVGNTNTKDFGKNLLNEIKGNFIPHERVQVFFIDPVDAGIKPVFNTCVPKLSPNEIVKIRNEGSMKYLLGGNPIDTANEDMSFFMADLKGVLIKALKEQRSEEVQKKELIEMFYNENSNFQEKPLQRVIVYSDMIQKSDQFNEGNIFSNTIFKKVDEYKIDFNFAEVYIYTSNKKFGITKHNKLIEFWKEYFERNNAHVGFFNDMLKLPKTESIAFERFKGLLKVSGKEYEAQIFLNFDKTGASVNSWFVISEIDAIPLRGKIKHNKGIADRGTLEVNNIINELHPLFSGDEKIDFDIKGNKLTGEIKLENTEVVLNGEKLTNPKFEIVMTRYDGI